METSSLLLTHAVAKNLGVHPEEAKERIGVMFELLTNEVSQGKKVEIRRFGNFWTNVKYDVEVRNPRTQETSTKARQVSPRFTASKCTTVIHSS